MKNDIQHKFLTKIVSTCMSCVLLGLVLTATSAQAQPEKGKILVVLSSENTLPLKNGKTYETGYYLNELIVPAQRFVAAGYELVFVDPKGNKPVVDALSISKDYFGGKQNAVDDALRFQNNLAGLNHPLTLKQVAASDLTQYKAVFVPGGPAPLIDLMANQDLGNILQYFHAHHKTTILLCHGPIALLSSTSEPRTEQNALRAGDYADAQKLAEAWPYQGYKMAVFSDEEEGIAAKYVFHADPLFTPQHALENAGALVSTVAAWGSNVVEDRELITGQNPGSDAAMMDLVLTRLSTQK